MSEYQAAAPGDTIRGLIGDWSDAFQRIGDALGLEGKFMAHYGYGQIEERAEAISELADNYRAVAQALGIVYEAEGHAAQPGPLSSVLKQIGMLQRQSNKYFEASLRGDLP